MFAITCALLVLVGGTGFGIARLDAHVEGLVLERTAPSLCWPDLPTELEGLAGADLRLAVQPLLDRPWIQADLCREMAERLARVAWVKRVRHVRRGSDGRFDISCSYRRPAALAQEGTQFFLVDGDGVRLPGSYPYDASWPLIQGATGPVPEPGRRWPGEDLTAGLSILGGFRGTPYADQVRAVLVDNFEGRVDPRGAHVELATARPGGRIHWGSAPGSEIEENNPAQKRAILEANYRRTGRIDAGHLVIDVSTFPDRFTIPG